MSHLPDIAPRFCVATYWWIATELVRRNPKLELVETYPMDGFYDCLTLHAFVGSREVHIDLNRNGSIHVHPDHIGYLDEWAALTRQDAHWAVKEIERIAGLTPADTAPASTGRTLTLRVIARLLNYLVNDRESWEVRMLDDQGMGLAVNGPLRLDPLGHENPFPSIFRTDDDFTAFRLVSGAMKPGQLWALHRDASPVAIFDTKGFVQTRTSRVALAPTYARLNRNLTLTMAHALGDVLP